MRNNGKITTVLFTLCPLLADMKERGGEFANVLMQRVGNPFGVDVFKHYKKLNSKCIPLSFDEFAPKKLHYNVNICRDNKVIIIRSWIENGIFAIGQQLPIVQSEIS